MKFSLISAMVMGGVIVTGIVAVLPPPPLPGPDYVRLPPGKRKPHQSKLIAPTETQSGRPLILPPSPLNRDAPGPPGWTSPAKAGLLEGNAAGVEPPGQTAVTNNTWTEPADIRSDNSGTPEFLRASPRGDTAMVDADFPELAVPFSIQEPSQSATIPAALAWMAAEGAEAPDPLEQQGIDRIAKAFLDGVEPHADSNTSSSYQHVWKASQEQADIAMKAQYGGQAWLLRHRAVHRQALANAVDSAQAPEPAD